MLVLPKDPDLLVDCREIAMGGSGKDKASTASKVRRLILLRKGAWLRTNPVQAMFEIPWWVGEET